jgi:hypothetical protein
MNNLDRMPSEKFEDIITIVPKPRFARLLLAICLLVFKLVPFFSHAQTDDLGSWNIVNVKYNFDEKWSVFTEAQVRSLSFYNNFHYHEFKGGINYRPYKNFQITLAAGDYDTYQEGGNFVTPKNNDEFRIWPQVLFAETVGRFKVEHRYRTELRFTSRGYRNRFRYRIGI